MGEHAGLAEEDNARDVEGKLSNTGDGGGMPSAAEGRDSVSAASDHEDRMLLLAARTGDIVAYGQLYSRHVRLARNLARRYTRQEADAADVVSEAFTGLYSALVGGRGPADNVRGYLAVSIRNAAATLSRRSQRLSPTDDHQVLERPMEMPEDPLTPEQTDVLRAAWADLQPRWRYILWELEIQGRKPAEIAREIGMSPNAVSALAKRARQGLRAAVVARLG